MKRYEESTRMVKITVSNSTDIANIQAGEPTKGVAYNDGSGNIYTQTMYLNVVEETVVTRPDENAVTTGDAETIIAQGQTQHICRLTIPFLPYSNLFFFHTLRDHDDVTIFFYPYVESTSEEIPENNTGDAVTVVSLSHQQSEEGDFFTGILELELHRAFRSNCEDNNYSPTECA
jgi:hypothetical protein